MEESDRLDFLFKLSKPEKDELRWHWEVWARQQQLPPSGDWRIPALEDELCGLISGGGYEGPGRSPDRADALVWALAELCLKVRAVPRVRSDF